MADLGHDGKSYDILGLGCVTVDDLLYVDTFPAGDVKVRVKREERTCGGLTGTALVAAAKLGGRCAFGGLLGYDPFSMAVEQNFVHHHVDVSHAVRRAAARPIHAMIVVAEATGTRNIFYDVSAPLGADDELPTSEVIEGARVLLIDQYGIAGNIRAAKIARAAGIPIVSDMEDPHDPRFQEALDLVDHLVCSAEFAQRMTGALDPSDSAARLFDGPARSAVVVTGGRDGAWYVEHRGEVRHCPAFPVEVIDTTGCGDVFHGAYALALARGEQLNERVRYASAAAALKATRSGGQAGSPTADEIFEFLAEEPR